MQAHKLTSFIFTAPCSQSKKTASYCSLQAYIDIEHIVSVHK